MRIIAFTAGCLWAIELALVVFDPLGVVFLQDFRAFRSWIVPAPDGYSMPAADYQFHGWTMTVGEDGNRVTPAATAGGPRVLFFGDSVTMAWGVSDRVTWVNAVTERLDLNATNWGRTGYSAAAVWALMQSAAGDSCVVFLSVSNDAETLGDLPTHDPLAYKPMLLQYVDFFRSLQGESNPDLESYDAAMRAMAARPNTLVLALGEDYSRIAAQYGAIGVPMYTGRIAAADAHANPDGNQQLADAITPIVSEWLSGRDCAA